MLLGERLSNREIADRMTIYQHGKSHVDRLLAKARRRKRVKPAEPATVTRDE